MKSYVCLALFLTWAVGCRETETLGKPLAPMMTAGKGAAGATTGAGGQSAAAPAGSGGSSASPSMVSKPGEYKGYSEKKYKEFALSSEYVAVRDGTKLAVDLYRPKKDDGSVVADPLPVLWMHTPYNRRYF